MNARDELALTIHTHHCIESVHNEDCMFWADDHESAEAVRTAGYSKPRTIKAAAELDSLAAGTVIRDGDPLTCIKWASGNWGTFSGDSVGSHRIALPATVLHEGGTK